MSRNPLSFLRSSRPHWPNPEESIDTEHYLGMEGKFHCWAARGPARNAFETIKPQIPRILDEYCDPLPSLSFAMFDIYMIGETRAIARPYIMFSCEYSQIKRQAVAAIKQSGLLNDLPSGIRLGGWLCPPNLRNLRYLMDSSPQDDVKDVGDWIPDPRRNHSIDSRVDPVTSRQSSDRPEVGSSTFRSRIYTSAKVSKGNSVEFSSEYLPKRIEHQALLLVLEKEKLKSDSLLAATIGATVTLEKTRYYLTPAHIWSSQDENKANLASGTEAQTIEGDFFLDGLDDTDESEAETQQVDVMSKYSLTPESTSQESSHRISPENSPSEIHSDPMDSPKLISSKSDADLPVHHKLTLGDIHSSCSLAFQPAPDTVFHRCKSENLDYRLIKIDAADKSLPSLPDLCPENIATLDENDPISARVFATTGQGKILKGEMFRHSSYVRLPNATEYTRTFLVQFDGSLQMADSGSLVRDEITGMIYGHIVAGALETQNAIIVPASDVWSDIVDSLKSQPLEVPTSKPDYRNMSVFRLISSVVNELDIRPARGMDPNPRQLPRPNTLSLPIPAQQRVEFLGPPSSFPSTLNNEPVERSPLGSVPPDRFSHDRGRLRDA